MLRARSIKRNLVLWIFAIASCLLFLFLIARDYTIMYVKINNRTAIAITTRDVVDETITKSNPILQLQSMRKKKKKKIPSSEKTIEKKEKKEKGSQSSRNKINSVSIYMDYVLSKITDPKKKEKEKEYLTTYNTERNKIIGVLPNVTRQSPETSFHVLVDWTSKPQFHKYDIIVLVSSQVSNFDRRTMIRKLWGNTALSLNKNFKVFFVCGGSIKAGHMAQVYEEAKIKKDVIIEDFMESWSANMGKKVMTALQWVTSNFNFDYILKSDDDVFVDIDAILTRIVKVVKETKVTEDLFMGNVMFGQPVERSGRYAISVTEHPAAVFKDYCSGGGYILSRSLIKKLIPIFQWEHPLRIDDAYIGDRVQEAGARATHQPGFMMWNDACEYKDNLLVSHPARDKVCVDKLQKMVTEKKLSGGTGFYVKYQ